MEERDKIRLKVLCDSTKENKIMLVITARNKSKIWDEQKKHGKKKGYKHYFGKVNEVKYEFES